MKIETKLNIGDEVYLLDNNKVTEGTVNAIFVTINKEYTGNQYGYENVQIEKYEIVLTGMGNIIFDGYRLFKTKQELIESL